MKTKILSILGLMAMGLTAVNASQVDQPKMNGKLKVTTLAPEDICYTGKPYSMILGAYVFNYRNYDAIIGRWTTSDESGYPDGANNRIYAPVPTNEIDAYGLARGLPAPDDFWNQYSPVDYTNLPFAQLPNKLGIAWQKSWGPNSCAVRLSYALDGLGGNYTVTNNTPHHPGGITQGNNPQQDYLLSEIDMLADLQQVFGPCCQHYTNANDLINQLNGIAANKGHYVVAVIATNNDNQHHNHVGVITSNNMGGVNYKDPLGAIGGNPHVNGGNPLFNAASQVWILE